MSPTNRNISTCISSLSFFDELNQAVLVLDKQGIIVWKSKLLANAVEDVDFQLLSPIQKLLNNDELDNLEDLLSDTDSNSKLRIEKFGLLFKRYNHIKSDHIVLYQLGAKSETKAFNKDQLELAVSATDIGLWEWDMNTNVLDWDDSMYKIFEAQKQQSGVTYEAWKKMLHPDDADEVIEQLQKALSGEIEFNSQFRIYTPKGKVKYVRAAAVIYRDEKGAAEQIVGISYDVTAKQNRLNRLKSNQFLLDTLFQQAPVGIYITDLEGKYLEINPAYENMIGYILPELNEMNYWDLTPIDFKEQEEIQSNNLLESGAFGPFQKEYMHKDGYRVPVLVYGVCIHDDASNEKLIWSVVQDLSVQQNMMNSLKRSKSEFNEFAYVASHDLREPLRVMASYVKILQERYGSKLDERGQRYIQKTLSASDRMNQLILDLLEYTKVDKKEFREEEIELNQLFRELENDMEIIIKESGLNIKNSLKHKVVGEKSQIYRVLQNLVSNSIKYRSPDRTPLITISSEQFKSHILVSVSDNGIGIKKDEVERVFRLFQRLHTREEYPGTGIGLSIVKKIIERHSGNVWIEPNLKHGITVHFTVRREK